MKALCGAASQCRGATTVRQLQTRGELWEAAGCVEHTERVQLQWHAKIVAIQTEARAAVQSTQPADVLHELCTIHTVSNWWCCPGRQSNGSTVDPSGTQGWPSTPFYLGRKITMHQKVCTILRSPEHLKSLGFMMMIVLLLFLQKQNLATSIYLFGLCTLLIILTTWTVLK